MFGGYKRQAKETAKRQKTVAASRRRGNKAAYVLRQRGAGATGVQFSIL